MRELKWFATLIAVIALGLFAAGCGDDDDSSSDSAAPTTEAESTAEDTEATEEPAEESTTEDTSSDASTPEDVYNACIDVIEESGASGAAEDAGTTACEQARSAFEQCSQQAEASGDADAAEIAIKACQQAADQTVAALQAGAG